jgi:lipopolysaccharide transport system ATP-binding protein
MARPIISAENIGKRYRLHHQAKQPYPTLRDTLSAQSKRLFGGSSAPNDSHTDSQEDFWALKEVSFEIQRGDVVGIIGRNGAGKSTLLKVLSRIVEPTTGRITLRGRVASLLEVGTGFHPELTGRENIFLNGAILGMSKREIRSKFDEIVAFAEIEKFLDTPVKRYSSGMYVRLAFAVAAHLEPEILIVDEVLAVGDAQFQKKCLGKMRDVAGGGRTVLFVSHNVQAISSLCGRGIYLREGGLVFAGPTAEAVRQYMLLGRSTIAGIAYAGPLQRVIHFTDLKINGRSGEGVTLSPAESIQFEVHGYSQRHFSSFRMALSVYRSDLRVFTARDVAPDQPLSEGEFVFTITVPAYLLRPGIYSVGLGGRPSVHGDWLYATDVCTFVVQEDWDEFNEQENEGVVNVPPSGKRHQD